MRGRARGSLLRLQKSTSGARLIEAPGEEPGGPEVGLAPNARAAGVKERRKPDRGRPIRETGGGLGAFAKAGSLEHSSMEGVPGRESRIR